MSSYKKISDNPQKKDYKELHVRLEGHLSFSFEFFKEIEYFGIGDCDNLWFGALTDAIRNYSGKNAIEIMSERSARNHAINWEQPNIPIRFEDLDWLPKNNQSLVSATELQQLSITKGSGRIVGFRVGNVFYVVLLDPNHNLQPSKDFDYKVNPTLQSTTQYDELKSKYDLLYHLTYNTLDEKQRTKIELSGFQKHLLYVKVSDEDLQNYWGYCCDATFSDMIDVYTLEYPK